MFKKIAIGVMLFFMAVSVPIIVPSCNSTSTPTGPGNNSTTPTVNTPTNKYFVSVIVTNLGGLGGCGMGIVKKDINNDGSFSQTINDAQITINSTNLTVDTSLGLYSTSSLSADAGTAYNMTAKEGGATIATGYAIMPSTPVISAPANLSNHAINSALPVTWSAIQHASSIEVSVGYIDATTMSSDTTVYDSPGLQPNQTSYTIPQTVFNLAGTYIINVDGIYVINAGSATIDSTVKGYNIAGPAGLFVAVSEAIDTVYVNTSLLVKKSTGKKRGESAKDRISQIARKWFPGIF